MKKLLYFICPTDCLESVIDDTFRQENYYYSSLGNSVIFYRRMLREIQKLIVEKNIKEISFVLSHDNRIVSDALDKQDFLNVRGLKNFYTKVIEQRQRVAILWESLNTQSLILSYYLNQKIKELEKGLKRLAIHGVKIKGKIYNKKQDSFEDIYHDLICMDYSNFN